MRLQARSVRLAGLCSLIGATLVLSAGCTNLTIITDPPGGRIVLQNHRGDALLGGPSPLNTAITFPSDGSRYIVVAEPSEADRKSYVTTTRVLTKAQYDDLPGGNSKLLEVKLFGGYSLMPDLNLFLGQEGWRCMLVPSRAYNNTSEVRGSVPQVVHDMENDIGVGGLSLSPDGETLIFSRVRLDEKDLALLKTWSMDKQSEEIRIRAADILAVPTRGGAAVEHITREDYQDMFPSFTNDGAHTLFSSNRIAPKSISLHYIDASGRGGITEVVSDPRGRRSVRATEAKNGTVAFALYPQDWKSPQDVEIWTQDAKSHFLTEVIRGVDPAISPDGTRIAYVGGDGNLWYVNVDGTQATQVSSDADDILKRLKDSLAGWELQAYLQRENDRSLLKYYHPYSFPSWSADGNRIVYGSMAAADVTGRPDENIWMRDLTTNKSEQLTTNGSVDRGPVMSPDGKWVYFMSNRGGRWCIWRIAAPAAEQGK